MHYFEFPSKDTTLYESSESINTGLDEILEIRKDMNDDGSTINVSRALLKFDLTYVSKSISSGLITSGSQTKFYLNLYDANSSQLNVAQTLYGYPVSQSWENGSGKYLFWPIVEDGVSWKWKDNNVAMTQWVSGSNDTGGTWYTGSGYEASQSFTHEPADLRMDVTDIAWKWLHSTVPNEGFMIKRSGSVGNSDSNAEEGNSTRYGHFSFFSSNTHTIYPPKLEVVWDDSTWATGSLSPLSSANLEDMNLYMRGFRPKYKENSKIKFKLVGRQRYPAKTYETTPRALQVNAFPSGTLFYSVKDALTEETIIPFDQYSAVSCDTSGHYFNLWLNGLQAERYYKLLYKFVSGSGTANEINDIHDNDFTFKVEK